MGVICIDRNTTVVDELQVAIKYTFDLATLAIRTTVVPIMPLIGTTTREIDIQILKMFRSGYILS